VAKIKDIAREAGVSASTVSYVLSSKKSISEDTRRRVKAVIRRLNYRPDARGRSLRAKRTSVVGVVAPPLARFTSLLLWGIDQALRTRGYRILLAHAEVEDELSGLFEKGQVDGVIFLVPGSLGDKWVGQIRDFDLPFVVMNQFYSGLPCVRTDYMLGAMEAVEHLIAHGHRWIGFVGENPNDSTQVAQQEGYCRALRRHGIEPKGVLIAPNSEAALERWVSLSDRPTAAFLTGEFHVSSFYQLARTHRIRIPEDVAVVGCGDDVYDATLSPPLTTLAQPYQAIGTEAVGLLFEGMEKEGSAGRSVQIPAQLVVRESCGGHGGVDGHPLSQGRCL